MGRPKATLTVGGEALAARAARILAEVCHPVLEVGPGYSALPHVVEEPPGAGPVAALLAGWDALGRDPGPAPSLATRRVLLVACDLPFVDAALLRLLAGWDGAPTVVPVAGGRPQPACARFGADAVAVARGVVAGGPGSFRALLDAVAVDYVDEARWRPVAAADALVDVDTPEDAARWGVERPR
jgi:molybdopterin-guanine dinucleotide biosynthesis protein A